MDKVQLFSIVNEMYYECKKSKKYSEDTFNFEKNEISNIIKLVNQLDSKTFKADNNYTFITLKPRPREIFATSLDTRICHYILEKNLRPIMEQELSDRTFNNRKGKGSTGAIKQVMKDISEVENCQIIKLDFKGYFPNANQKIAYREMKELLDKSECKNKDFLDQLLKVTMFSQPQKHCYKKSDDKMWNKIPPEKSLFNKEDYYGGAIGFLIWQMAMGVYPNKVIKWIRNKGIKVTVFVDDLIFVTADKNRVLNLISEIRKLLKKFKIH